MLSKILAYATKVKLSYKRLKTDSLFVGIAIPDCFSNPGISGLKNANPGIPGLNPGIESLILNK